MAGENSSLSPAQGGLVTERRLLREGPGGSVCSAGWGNFDASTYWWRCPQLGLALPQSSARLESSPARDTLGVVLGASSRPYLGDKRASCLSCDDVAFPLEQTDRALEARHCSLRIASKLEHLCLVHP